MTAMRREKSSNRKNITSNHNAVWSSASRNNLTVPSNNQVKQKSIIDKNVSSDPNKFKLTPAENTPSLPVTQSGIFKKGVQKLFNNLSSINLNNPMQNEPTPANRDSNKTVLSLVSNEDTALRLSPNIQKLEENCVQAKQPISPSHKTPNPEIPATNTVTTNPKSPGSPSMMNTRDMPQIKHDLKNIRDKKNSIRSKGSIIHHMSPNKGRRGSIELDPDVDYGDLKNRRSHMVASQEDIRPVPFREVFGPLHEESPSLARKNSQESHQNLTFTRNTPFRSSTQHANSHAHHHHHTNSDKLPGSSYKKLQPIYKHSRLIKDDRKMPLTVLHIGGAGDKEQIYSEFYHAMQEATISFNVFIMFVAYVAMILLFTCIYYGLETWSDGQCLTGVIDPDASPKNFTTAFLLALESQTTIGYGGRHPKDNCIWPMFVNSAQYILNLVLLGYVTVMVYNRLVKRRGLDLIRFAKNAVICERNGHLSLLVRVASTSSVDILSSTITAKLLCTRISVEQEFIPLEELEVDFDNQWSILTNIPIDYVHTISEDARNLKGKLYSPFWDVNAQILDPIKNPNINFELVVICNVTIASTGTTYQCKKSYTTKEIKWGERYEQCIFKFNKQQAAEYINLNKLHRRESSESSGSGNSGGSDYEDKNLIRRRKNDTIGQKSPNSDSNSPKYAKFNTTGSSENSNSPKRKSSIINLPSLKQVTNFNMTNFSIPHQNYKGGRKNDSRNFYIDWNKFDETIKLQNFNPKSDIDRSIDRQMAEKEQKRQDMENFTADHFSNNRPFDAQKEFGYWMEGLSFRKV